MEEWIQKIVGLLRRAETEEQMRLIYRFVNGMLQ